MTILTSADLTDLKQFLKKLRKNLTVLQERKAKYADSAPLALLNQLDDYKTAIDLTKDTLIGDLEAEELEQALKPLILELGGPAPQQATLKIPPPPNPLKPPEIRGFVGREEELNYFITKLEETNLALITGMIGCGKTILAAVLAQTWQIKQQQGVTNISPVGLSQADFEQINRKIFWYTFHQDEGLLGLVHALAGFLYYDGYPDLWEMLERTRLTNASPPSPANLFDYVFQMIHNKGYLFCLDDVQFIHDDKLLDLFVDRLRDLLNRNELQIIFTAREKPTYITQSYKPIAGLNQADTIHLLKERGLNLSNELNIDVYNLTEGNTKLLNLTILILQKSKNPSHTLKNLAQSDDIERYLLKQVDSSLNDIQRDTLITIALLLGYPANRGTIEEISGHRRLKRTILALSDRYLLTVHDDYDDDLEEELYGTHTIIRNFYYDFPSRRELKKLHTLAAEIYQEEEDFIKAARHYKRAEQYQTAVELLTTHFWSLMNQGKVQALQRLLEQLLKQNLTELQTIKATLALADIYRKATELATAREYYQQCLNQLPFLVSSTDKQILMAQAYHGMAKIVKFDNITEALQLVEQGLTNLESANQQEEASLLLLKSELQMRQANYQAARQTIEEILPQISLNQNWLYTMSLKQLGIIYHLLGDNEQAIQVTLQAVASVERSHSHFEKVNTLNNLGIFQRKKGDLVVATSTYQQALNLAKNLGMIEAQFTLEGNLGNLYMKLGKFQETEQYFFNQLKMGEERDINYYKVMAHINFGQLYVKQAQFNKAKEHLKDTLTAAPKVGLSDWIPHIYCYLALIDLAKNQTTTALQQAKNAVQKAQEFKLPLEEGFSWRVLGQAHLANKDSPSALEAFAKSSTLLIDTDLYELALTQLEWGRYLISTPQVEQAKQQLQAAHSTFKQMGANVDLAETEVLLQLIVDN